MLCHHHMLLGRTVTPVDDDANANNQKATHSHMCFVVAQSVVKRVCGEGIHIYLLSKSFTSHQQLTHSEASLQFV